MQHGHPACLGRAIELEQPRVPEIFHDGALGVRSRGRRRDHELGDPAGLAALAHRRVQPEHHHVLRRHQRGEGLAARRNGAQKMLGIEALAVVDRAEAAAIGKRASKVERVGVTHRHREQRAVGPAEAEFDRRDQGQQSAGTVAADRALGRTGRAGGVHQRPAILRKPAGARLCVTRLAVARACDDVLVGRVTRRGCSAAEGNELSVLNRDIRADLLDRSEQIVLHDQGTRPAVLQDEAHLAADEPKVDRHRNEASLCGRGIDFHPFDAVVGEHGKPVALSQAESRERVRKAARPRIPLAERHRAGEITRAQALGINARVRAQNVPHAQQRTHGTLP